MVLILKGKVVYPRAEPRDDTGELAEPRQRL
jgi:hypothetical protein